MGTAPVLIVAVVPDFEQVLAEVAHPPGGPAMTAAANARRFPAPNAYDPQHGLVMKRGPAVDFGAGQGREQPIIGLVKVRVRVCHLCMTGTLEMR